VDGRYLSLVHIIAPNDSLRSPRHRRSHFATESKCAIDR
jgi:hypothetical protein